MLKFQSLINQWDAKGLLRNLRQVDSGQSSVVMIQGRSLLSFSSNNYLGLANHPVLKNAASAAIEQFGVGSGASRLISGNHTLFSQLETRLARFKQTESALIFNSGYVTNLTVLPALVKRGDLILADRHCHASLFDGCRLSGATLRIFRHNNLNHLEHLLKKKTPQGKALIITEGVFSMEGDIAPLNELIELAERYDAYVYLDDAHATGTLGKEGRGTLEHFGIGNHPRMIQMGTFSKALGSFGGYVAGPRILTRYLIQKARGFIYTTALPPTVLAASLAALDLVRQEVDLRASLWNRYDQLKKGITALGLNTMGSQTHILPVLLQYTQEANRYSERLFERGIYVPAIRPPTVPNGTARLRFSIMATHTEEQIDLLLSAVEHVAKERGPC